MKRLAITAALLAIAALLFAPFLSRADSPPVGVQRLIGVPTASLPTCAAGSNGHMLFDSTTATTKRCNGSAWVAVASGDVSCTGCVALGSEVSGTLPIANGGTGASSLSCTSGDFLTSNGSTLSCATPTGGVTSIGVTAPVTSTGGSTPTIALGTVGYGNGGTGTTSLTNHGVVVAGASALTTVAPGTSGYVLTSNGTDWTSAAATGSLPIQAARLDDGLISNLYIYAPHSTGSGGSATAGTGNIRSTPIVFGRSGTVNRLGVVATSTVANAKGRIGLYEAGTTGYPTTLIVESGELDVSSSGFKSTSGLSASVSGGKAYWLAWLGGTASGSMLAPSTNTVVSILGGQPQTTTNTIIVGITVAQSYGSMPGTFPASATGVVSAPQIPLMFVGVQ